MDVAEPGRHLSLHRGFLKVSEENIELGRVPLDDITALILSAPQISMTKSLMVALAERKAVIVICGRNWHPVSMTLPFDVHYEAAGVLHDQISASEPLRKRLWQQIVRAKIGNQISALARHAPGSPALEELGILQRRVQSGDPTNMEAQAARRYWPALMGADFRRDRKDGDVNAFLNYGYTVLRAATARAVCGTGLHPALGLHHKSRINAFALVDDLMEPFCPAVDSIAHEIVSESNTLGPEEKRRLASVLQEDMLAENGASPVINCLSRIAQSLCASLKGGSTALAIPEMRPAGRLV